MTSTAVSSTPRRPVASSTGCTATRSARSCGARSCPACPPAGCRASPSASSWSGSGSGCAFVAAVVLGPSTPPFVARAADDVDSDPFGVRPGAARRRPDRQRSRLRRRRAAPTRRRRGARRGRAERARLGARRAAADRVRSVESRPYRRRPAAPFMTSTLQQEAGRKLRLRLGPQAMRAAQRALRERLHHLHADRQHHAVRRRRSPRPAGRSARVGYGGEYLPTSPAATPTR